ncbi:MAG: hypothetical protein J0M08_06475 [Bacteroidetes bacterium]|nr:hypothetical protein [Bacteroidota bacterium]
MIKQTRLFNYISIVSVSTILSVGLLGCGGNVQEDTSNLDSTTTKVDSNASGIIKVNGQIFSIPSPIQTALLIKKVGSNYDKSILNQTSKSTSYSTNFSKALNLGVYGADLGYISIYEQSQDAIGYLNTVRKLATDLGVMGAFDNSVVERFSKNIGNKDSLLTLVSVAYRATDAYLKENQRNDVSSLVLAGGWIESLHFAVSSAKGKNNAELNRRIGEQKSSILSLIKMLNANAGETPTAEYTDLITKLTDLEAAFAGVEIKYSFDKPTVDVNNKTTTVTSKSEVNITPEQLDIISQKIQSIRNLIVG